MKLWMAGIGVALVCGLAGTGHALAETPNDAVTKHPGYVDFGTVNLFGGCPRDTSIRLDTSRVHYDELTLKGTFHHTPSTVRTALDLIADGRIPAKTLIQQRAPLSELPDVLKSLLNGNCAVKVAIDTARGV